MKKVLFVYYMFPPLIGGWRAIASFVRFLPEFGWQAIVLTAADSVSYGKDYTLLDEVPQDLEIHRVGHREVSAEWRYARNSKLKLNLDFPDSYRSWYAPALREARRILQHQDVRLVFSYAPPYTCHFVAMQLKREFGLPWVADSEDPWSGNEFLKSTYKATLLGPLRPLQNWRIRRAERNLLKNADRTIVVSWYHQRQLCALHGIGEDDLRVINNGYDELDFEGLSPHRLYPDRPTIVFLGSFYPEFREPFLRFLDVLKEVDEGAEVILVGQVGQSVAAALQGSNLTRISYVPKRKALSFCLAADFLLVIMPPSAKWIPMKTYDYLRLGRPILALVPEDGDTARIIREGKAGFLVPFDPEPMKQQLQAVLARWREGEFREFKPDQEYVRQFERRNLAERIVQIFNEVAF